MKKILTLLSLITLSFLLQACALGEVDVYDNGTDKQAKQTEQFLKRRSRGM
jgi:hypothetical protein